MSRNRGILSAITTIAQIVVLGAIVALSHGGIGVGATGSIAVSGIVNDSNGNGIGGVTITADMPGTKTVEFGPMTTASDGTYALDVTAGTYDFHFNPPSGSGLNPIVDNNITILNSQTIDIVLYPVNHTLSGTITDANGNPVPGVYVDMSQGGATTDANGHYSMTVPAGVYTALYGSYSNSNPPNGLPDSFGFTSSQSEDLTNGDATENIQLPQTATVKVVAEDVNGNPLSRVSTQIYSWNGPTSESLTFSGNATYGETNASGAYTTTVFQGSMFDAGQVCANIPPSYASVCNQDTVSATSGGVTVTLVAPTTHTLSGTITDANGNPVPGVYVDMSQGGATTDANGHYSMTVPAGVYTALYGSYSNSNPPNGLPDSFGFTSSQSEDLTNGDATENIQLPQTATVTTITNDANGNPLSGVSIEDYYWTGPSPGDLTFNGNAVYGTSNASGAYTTTVFQGSMFDVGQLCANFPPSGASVCNQGQVSTTNGNVTLILQQNPPITIPLAPANLSAPSPTNQSPSLSWSPSSGATSYNVYRDGTLIGSTANTSYIDSAVAEGAYTYYVTAVNDAGYSSSSNTVSVLYDTTPPTITYTLSPVPNSASWNNTPVTVTFSCSDAGSGIATCTAPVTVSTDGANQTVTGTATDNAGNTSTVTATVNLDTTVPMVGTPSWSTNPVVTGNNTILTAPATATDSSPITGGEYYLGTTDPGQGNGTPMTYTSSTGNLTATVAASMAPGSYQVNIRTVNAAGTWSPVVTTSLVVKPAAVAPTITSANNYSTGVRQIITPSDFTVTATGTPTPALTESGTLPSGLSFTDNGNGTANFTGMVAAGAAGTYTFTVEATNSAGTVSQTFTLTITDTTSAPTTIFTSTGSDTMNATVGTSASFTFTATGSGTNQKLFVYSGTLPAGMNLHDNKDGTGTISGTPTTAGTYTFTVEAQNKLGVTYQTFTIVVSS